MPTIRATLVSFTTTPAWAADVRPDGGPAATLTAIPVSRAIPSAEMTPGRRVIVDTGDHNDPNDAVVTAVWP